MRYVLIENGKMIDGPRMLPDGWKNISGLKFLPEDVLFNLGWRRYEFVPYEGDMAGKVSIEPRFEVTSTEYIEYQQVREKTQDEINLELESMWSSIIEIRNRLLAESDWTQLQDSSISTEKKAEWAKYRQDLRNLPQTFTNPNELVWPTRPES